MPTLSPPWLTIREAAARLDRSMTRVWQLTRNGKLRVRIIRGQTHVNARDVNARKADPPPAHRRPQLRAVPPEQP